MPHTPKLNQWDAGDLHWRFSTMASVYCWRRSRSSIDVGPSDSSVSGACSQDAQVLSMILSTWTRGPSASEQTTGLLEKMRLTSTNVEVEDRC